MPQTEQGLIIGDFSEYQGDVDWDAFIAGGEVAAIVRADNGSRADNYWQHNAAGASRLRWWGAYQYLQGHNDPRQAAQRLISVLGSWRPNVTVCDDEETAGGDEQQRVHNWLDVMANDPAKDWLYTGDYYARIHFPSLFVDWDAAYGQRNPTRAHTLWQYTDKRAFPGVRGLCDASIFFGTVDDLIAITGGGTAAVEKKLEDDMYMQILMQGDAPGPAGDAWWLTDGMRKRHIFAETWPQFLVEMRGQGAVIKTGPDNGPLKDRWPQAVVDSIPEVQAA